MLGLPVPVCAIDLFAPEADLALLLRDGLVELERAMAFQEALVDSMDTLGVLVLDLNFRVTYASPGALRLTGYGEAELLGRSPRFLAVGEEALRPGAGDLTTPSGRRFPIKGGFVSFAEPQALGGMNATKRVGIGLTPITGTL